MTHFKNKNTGFTLMEVLVALTIMALILTPLFVTQSTLVQQLITSTSHLNRIYTAQNFLYFARAQAGEQQKFSLEKKIDDPQTDLKYEASLVAKSSPIKDTDALVQEKISITWNENNKKQQDQLVSYMYKPEPPKSKKK